MNLTKDSPNANFSVFLPCDLDNDRVRFCVIEVDRATRPIEVPRRRIDSVTVQIQECEKQGEFCTVSG